MKQNGVNRTRTDRGFRIKVSRMRKGLKQYELAQKLSIHPSLLSSIEAGRRAPTEAQLAKLEKVLGEKF